MVEPSLVELVTELHRTYFNPLVDVARTVAPVAFAYWMFISGTITNLRKNRNNPEQHLRNELNAAGLDDLTVDEFYSLSRSESGRVNFVFTHRILQNLSNINDHVRVMGRADVNPFYEP